ncbi:MULTISPECIES: hypothetical protein [Pacificibacter]|uniref:hypothetical protein n=1 Tax=Pacificibacter TaxID=1042323 RepID=UPI001C09FACB|nr:MULTISPECIES: hypothetical protein [Pacificibacter]MBU2936495.1 hypothetical protein [Pacificibacter marinus]MDO6614703.1 hypothetical protein [Pacificibacter sp. 1_MG-2023]
MSEVTISGHWLSRSESSLRPHCRLRGLELLPRRTNDMAAQVSYLAATAWGAVAVKRPDWRILSRLNIITAIQSHLTL